MRHRLKEQRVCLQLPTSADNVTLVAFAAERRAAAQLLLLLDARRPPLSIDISCQHGAQQQTRRTSRLRANGTDRRTPYRYIDPTLRILYEQCQ